MSPELKREFKRKIFHFFSFFYALAYFLMEKNTALAVLGTMLAVEAAVEFGRFLAPALNQKIVGMFGGIHREDELVRASGIFWTLAGSFLLMAAVPDRASVLCAMSFLIFGDSAAALIGVPFGKHRYRHKSIEGSASFFIASFIAGLFFVHPLLALAGAAVAAATEALPLPWNDNFWVPIISGTFLYLLK